ncbi:hypothetical protein A2U01_0030357, partial [Trifolium medium]|nr:hypothetical protein [Trifolium medium]
ELESEDSEEDSEEDADSVEDAADFAEEEELQDFIQTLRYRGGQPDDEKVAEDEPNEIVEE